MNPATAFAGEGGGQDARQVARRRLPRDRFAERLEALVADLEALDAEQSAATASAAGRPVVFSHPVYQ